MSDMEDDFMCDDEEDYDLVRITADRWAYLFILGERTSAVSQVARYSERANVC